MLTYAPPLLGRTTPRIFTPPLVTGPPGPCGCGCALTPATSLGFSALAFAETVMNVVPLPWQRWLLIHAMELRPGGAFRFRTVIIMVARQNGKTTAIEVKNLWKMFVLEVPLVIGTAQDLDTAEESWDKAVEIVESIPELDAEKAHVDKTNGKKALRLTNGSRWKIKAATKKAGRGLSGDDVNLDELREHQSWDAWGAVTKTTMARPNAQIFAFSNAGDDRSIVLNDLQGQGRAAANRPTGADTSLGFFEWSAPDDVKCTCGRPDETHTPDCRLQDRDAWAQANPALGYTITEAALASALSTDPEAVFRTECLCQRVASLQPDWAVVSRDAWEATEDGPVEDNDGNVIDPGSQPLDPVAFAIDVTPSMDWASIGVAGRRADGLLHVELVEHEAGTAWVVDRVLQLIERWGPCAVVLDAGGPAGSLTPDLDAAGIELKVPKSRDVTSACGAFYSALVRPTEAADDWAPSLRHQPHPALSVALAGATKRTVGDAWAWSRRDVSIVISPLVAVTLAAWGFATREEPTEERPPNLW